MAGSPQIPRFAGSSSMVLCPCVIRWRLETQFSSPRITWSIPFSCALSDPLISCFRQSQQLTNQMICLLSARATHFEVGEDLYPDIYCNKVPIPTRSRTFAFLASPTQPARDQISVYQRRLEVGIGFSHPEFTRPGASCHGAGYRSVERSQAKGGKIQPLGQTNSLNRLSLLPLTSPFLRLWEASTSTLEYRSPASAMKRSIPAPGAICAPCQAPRHSLALSRPSQPLFQSTSATTNLDIGMSSVKRSSFQNNTNALKSYAPGGVPNHRASTDGERRSSVYRARPSTHGVTGRTPELLPARTPGRRRAARPATAEGSLVPGEDRTGAVGVPGETQLRDGDEAHAVAEHH